MTFIHRTSMAFGFCAALIGCAYDSDVSDPPSVASEALSAPPDTGQYATQSGRIVVLRDETTGVVGATVQLGSKSATTGLQPLEGSYAVRVTRDQPFTMRVSAPNFTTLIDQEWSISTNINLVTAVPTTSFTNFLIDNFLTSPAFDVEKGALGIGLVFENGCPDESGATLRVDPPGSAVVRYFRGGIPSDDTKTQKGESSPTALFYNLEPGVYNLGPDAPPPRIIVEGPCKVAPFPHLDLDIPSIEYTGKVTVVATGKADARTTSFADIFVRN